MFPTGGVLVDSNVIFDYLSQDEEWFDWSAAMLAAAAEAGAIVINPVIYSEVSVRFARIEDVDLVLPADYFVRSPIPWAASFLAAKCFAQYKRRGGTRSGTLPDFYIGAHAAVSGLALLTRDARRYRQYFPKLRIIAP